MAKAHGKAEREFISSAVIGCFRFGHPRNLYRTPSLAVCASAPSSETEHSVTQGRQPPNIRSAAVRIAFGSRFIYLFHIFTQGKPKQLTLVSIGALHTFHIVINMYVNLNIIQYSQICASITHIKTLHV